MILTKRPSLIASGNMCMCIHIHIHIHTKPPPFGKRLFCEVYRSRNEEDAPFSSAVCVSACAFIQVTVAFDFGLSYTRMPKVVGFSGVISSKQSVLVSVSCEHLTRTRIFPPRGIPASGSNSCSSVTAALGISSGSAAKAERPPNAEMLITAAKIAVNPLNVFFIFFYPFTVALIWELLVPLPVPLLYSIMVKKSSVQHENLLNAQKNNIAFMHNDKIRQL